MPPKVAHVTGQDRHPKPRWFPRLLVAASVALIAAAGVGVNVLQGSNSPRSELSAGVVRVFEAPDADQTTLKTTNGATISVASSPSLQRVAVDTDQLPELDSAQVYQLWTIADGSAESAGLLRDPDAGVALAMPEEGTTIAITIEPAGGSDQPTDAPIVAVTPRQG
jgi:anti-sigma-K factor RskA